MLEFLFIGSVVIILKNFVDKEFYNFLLGNYFCVILYVC